MNKNRLGLLSTVTLGVFLLTGCGKSSNYSNQSSQKLNWMQPSNLMTLDPSKSVDTTSANTLSNVSQGLLTSPEGSKVVAGVAKSYKVSKDGKTYTFDLRKSKWSNGDSVTAKDFVYGFQRTVNPKTASQNAYLYDHFLNYNGVKSGKMNPNKLGVSAPNNYTLVVKLSKPQSYFKYLVTQTAFLPQNEKVATKYGKGYGTSSDKQVYNGPFVAKGWTGTNDSWRLNKNTNFWDRKVVKLNSLKMNVVKSSQTGLNQYQTGALDALSLTNKQQVDNFKNSKEFKKNQSVYSNFIEMNRDKVKAFKNLKIRQALSLAINRNQFVNNVMGDGSTVTKGFVASGLAYKNGKDYAETSHVKGTTDYNLSKAKKLWNEGLKETGHKGMNLTLTYDDNDVAKATSDFLQSEWEKLPGLTISNINIPKQQRIARMFSGNYDLCVTGWDAGYADPIAALAIKISSSPMNFGKWSNKTYDNLINKSDNQDANNSNARWNDMVQAQKVLANDVGAIPFYQSAKPSVVKDKVNGLEYNPIGSGWDFTKAYIK
ncbi:peptide ABC transporter substrate-binding protein [Apilactobacillus sp. TMW 2.2459]|uniref:peptide ABC transporter substrate-binding protein n=1 Tax=Apilactobacillus xinyiensis TaxID=2841032 RepID=UPI00200C063B|nr:peptide ABC transporter substrate-binding protein [Apilactobacillus xinyiensis]MCL0312148.1 peptide ABC transporter substrate-binding protein [Apilactobacillus xinyiensis]